MNLENNLLRNTHTSSVAWLWIFVVVLWSMSCWGASRKPFGGTIALPIYESVKTTNPVYVSNESEILISRQIHDTVLRLGKDGNIEPSLAQSIPDVSDDGFMVTIRIRPGLVFHDGSAVDAHALVSSWKKLLAPDSKSPHWWLLAGIDGALGFHAGKVTDVSGLEKINSLTVRVLLVHQRNASRYFFEAIASLPTALLPARQSRNDEQMVEHPSGAGPFVLDDDVPGGEYVLTPFAKHWHGRPYLQSVVFRLLPSVKQRTLEFELGRLDIMTDKPKRNISELNVVTGPICHRFFMVFNEKRINEFPQGFKKAMLWAIDKNALADYAVGDMGRAEDEFILPADRSTFSKVKGSDIAKARAYFKALAEHRFGVSGLIQLLVRADSPIDRAIAERLQVDLVDAGVVLVVVPLDAQAYRIRMESGEYELRLEHLQAFVRSAQMQLIQLNARALNDSATRDLIHWISSLPNATSREGIIRERARSMAAKTSWVPLFDSGTSLYVNKMIRELSIGFDGTYDLSKVWLAK